jgi:plastocyanin
MVTGPPAMANVTEQAPSANETGLATAENATLPVLPSNTTETAETAPVGANTTETGGATAGTNATTGAESNLTALSGETANSTTGAESLATEGGGVNATQTGEATPTGATGGGGAATSVSIVPGSSTLTDTAFSPNPVQVSVGDTVIWTNDDTQPHTVVSGENAQPSGEFDSSPNFNPLLAPKQTFEHTFTQAGEYPYYCALHPNMVGTVSVS